MANPIRGQVALALLTPEGQPSDEVLTLSFSIDAICQVEKELGLPWSRIRARFATDDSVTFLRALLWGGLRDHHPEIGVREAGELMLRAPNALVKVMEALGLATPEPKGGAKPRPPTAPGASGTGKRSSASGSNSKSARPKASGGRRLAC